MALRLVIGACSNEYVASWALQRMDDDLMRRTRREAAYLGKPPGRFVAEIVRDFERTSDFAARANAARSIRHSRGDMAFSRMYTISGFLCRCRSCLS